MRPNLRLMPGTHTTVMVIPDTTVHTADITVVDGVDTMVDITGTLAMDTDTDFTLNFQCVVFQILLTISTSFKCFLQKQKKGKKIKD